MALSVWNGGVFLMWSMKTENLLNPCTAFDTRGFLRCRSLQFCVELWCECGRYFLFRKFYLCCNDAAGQFLYHFCAFIFDDDLFEEVCLYIVSDLMMKIGALGFAGERKCLTGTAEIV